MKKSIILCADDFGQAPHISEAILTLAQHGRISATSCMTTCSDWAQHGTSLKDLRHKLDIGLHFNLTHGEKEPLPSPFWWLLKAMTGQINTSLIETKLNEQLDRFVDIMGVLPDFIDGHQHVHSFPLIRDVVIKVIQTRFFKKKPYVRSLRPMLSITDSHLKAFVIKYAASGFSEALDKREIKHNPLFGGLYSLSPHTSYRNLMVQWLRQVQPYTLLMCHPGKEPKCPTDDPIQVARLQEYTYFLGDAFLEDCVQTQVVIGRMTP